MRCSSWAASSFNSFHKQPSDSTLCYVCLHHCTTSFASATLWPCWAWAHHHHHPAHTKLRSVLGSSRFRGRHKHPSPNWNHLTYVDGNTNLSCAQICNTWQELCKWLRTIAALSACMHGLRCTNIWALCLWELSISSFLLGLPALATHPKDTLTLVQGSNSHLFATCHSPKFSFF